MIMQYRHFCVSRVDKPTFFPRFKVFTRVFRSTDSLGIAKNGNVSDCNVSDGNVSDVIVYWN